MTVKEAIKEIIKLRGLLIFNDYNKFKAMLLDFGNSNQKELNVFKTAVDEKMLKLCIDDSLENSRKITKIKIQLEDKGFSDNTIDFVIESFAFALGWNYTKSKQLQSQKAQPQHASSSTDWTCVCGTVNTANFCGNCGASKPVLRSTDWTCDCGTVNTTNFCINCGKKKGENQTQQIQQNVQQNPTKNQVQKTNYIEVTLDNSVIMKLGYKETFKYKQFRNYKILKKNKIDVGYLDIPLTYTWCNKDYLIRKIDKDIFCNCESLWHVTIPNGIIEIGDNAFSGCIYLSNIKIPNSVNKIGDNAFCGCRSLKNITIPNSITQLANGTFRACSSLTTVMIPSGVTKIGEGTFIGCSSLISIIIPNSVTKIGEEAFDSCSSLISIKIPNSVTKIGERAFEGIDTIYYDGNAKGSTWGANQVINRNYNYIEVKLNGNVLKQLGYDVKYENYGEYNPKTYLKKNGEDVTDLVIPSTYSYNGKKYKITQIGGASWSSESIFAGCSSLKSVTIPNSVTLIGDSTFRDCSSLTSIKIPNSVTQICSNAFEGCKSLTNLIIPSSVTKIGYGTFRGCSSLTSIIIPNSVTQICSNAFEGCKLLRNLVIPDSLTEITERIFSDCSSLASLNIPNSITQIGASAFSGCSSLASLTIPNSVTQIGDRAFEGCSLLTNLIIPNSVVKIDELAFAYVPHIEYHGTATGAPWGALSMN